MNLYTETSPFRFLLGNDIRGFCSGAKKRKNESIQMDVCPTYNPASEMTHRNVFVTKHIVFDIDFALQTSEENEISNLA